VDYPLVDITIYKIPFEPNFYPSFDGGLADIEIIFDIFSGTVVGEDKDQNLWVTGNGKVSYPLPAIFDLNEDDSHKITVEGIQDKDFITYDPDSMNFNFDIAKMDRFDIGTHEVKVRVEDKDGRYSDYTWRFTLRGYDFTPPPVKKEDKKDDGLFRARIYSIDSDGHVRIWFEKNLTLEVPSTPRRALSTDTFNLMNLTSEHLDIYVEPSEQRWERTYFTWPKVNLTWTLQSVKDNWIDVQLYFDQPDEISPLIELDTVVVHIRESATHLFIATDGDKLKYDYYTLKSRVPQIRGGCNEDTADRLAQIFGKFARVAFVFALVLQWVSNRGFSFVLMYVRTL
jgi:hypothetical protein